MISCWLYHIVKQASHRRPAETASKHGQGRADSTAGSRAGQTAEQGRAELGRQQGTAGQTAEQQEHN